MSVKVFAERSGRCLRVWGIILALELCCCFILAIIGGALKPHSNLWLLEFLSWTKGLPNGSQVGALRLSATWFPIYAALSLVSVWFSYSLIKSMPPESRAGESAPILARQRKLLRRIVILTFVSVFALVIHGALWWLTGILCWIMKAAYYRENRKLDSVSVMGDIEGIAIRFKEEIKGITGKSGGKESLDHSALE